GGQEQRTQQRRPSPRDPAGCEAPSRSRWSSRWTPRRRTDGQSLSPRRDDGQELLRLRSPAAPPLRELLLSSAAPQASAPAPAACSLPSLKGGVLAGQSPDVAPNQMQTDGLPKGAQTPRRTVRPPLLPPSERAALGGA
ncbi:unnamed protein product, partial [Polarella glacialis]